VSGLPKEFAIGLVNESVYVKRSDLKQWLIQRRAHLLRTVIDEAVDQRRSQLNARVKRKAITVNLLLSAHATDSFQRK